MKSRFSIERALSDSAGLAWGRPLTTFVWGLVALLPVLAVLVAFVMLAGSSTLMSEDPSTFMQSGAATTFDLLINLANIGQLFTGAIVTAAVVRAVAIQHRRRRGAPPYLALGVEELLAVAVCLALGIGLVVAIIPVVLVGVAIGFGIRAVNEAAAWWVLGGYVVIAFVGLIILALRLSLVLPASILNRTFAFPEGWRVARGQVLRLLGLAVISWLICVAVSIGVMVVAGIVGLIAVMASGWNPETLEDVRQLSDIVLPWPIWVVAGVGLLLFGWLQGFAQIMTAAPFASAYLQLTQPKSVLAADETPPDALASPEL